MNKRVLRMLLIALKLVAVVPVLLKVQARIAHAINSVETATYRRSASANARIAHAINSVETNGTVNIFCHDERVLRMLLIALKLTKVNQEL